MTIDHVFLIANWGVLPPWLLLVFAPRWRVTRVVVHSIAPCLVLAPLYGFLLFADRPGPEGASFWTLAGVTHIFTTPWTITACWIHYLVFDLFVGAWEARDAERLRIRHVFVVPSLVLTLLFGPLGWLSWGLVRWIWKRRFSTSEQG
ncbi:MAG: ABA4-like family protein [Polyangiaceae bacterium]